MNVLSGRSTIMEQSSSRSAPIPDTYYFQNTPDVTSVQLILSFSLTVLLTVSLTIFVQSPWSGLCCIRLYFVIITLHYIVELSDIRRWVNEYLATVSRSSKTACHRRDRNASGCPADENVRDFQLITKLASNSPGFPQPRIIPWNPLPHDFTVPTTWTRWTILNLLRLSTDYVICRECDLSVHCSQLAYSRRVIRSLKLNTKTNTTVTAAAQLLLLLLLLLVLILLLLLIIIIQTVHPPPALVISQ